jgi:hypothetical protein
MSYLDLQSIVNTKFKKEIAKDDLKYKKFIRKDPVTKKSTFLFLSNTQDDSLKQWLSFFGEIRNILVGIYIIPLEMSFLVQKVVKTFKIERDWVLCSYLDGDNIIKQVVTYKKNIVFEKSLDINYDDKTNFLNNFNNDCIKITEYMKKYDFNFRFDKLIIINILDQPTIDIIQKNSLYESIIHNLTIENVVEKLKIRVKPKESIPISSVNVIYAANNPKAIRFFTPNILKVKNLVATKNTLQLVIFILSIVLITFICWESFSNYSQKNDLNISSIKLNRNRKTFEEDLPKQIGFSNQISNALVDFGQLREIFTNNYVNPVNMFQEFIKKTLDGFLVSHTKWEINNFKIDDLTNYKSNVKVTYNGAIINEKGSLKKIEETESKLQNDLQNLYTGKKLNYSKIDFTKINKVNTFYTYPVNFTFGDVKTENDTNDENNTNNRRQRRNRTPEAEEQYGK